MPDLRQGCTTGKPSEDTAPADALVLFGAMGDLAHKKIFPALYHQDRPNKFGTDKELASYAA
jgi:glucose-6-phosphate 1-dehydrogenase